MGHRVIQAASSLWKIGDGKYFPVNTQHRTEELLIMGCDSGEITSVGVFEEDYFLATCMLCTKTPADVISPESHPMIKSSSVLCCVFTGKYLPLPIFHRLLAACITRWPIAQRNMEKLIFCGCCSFEIDHTHRLILFSREYVIFARLTKMSSKEENPDQAVCIQVRLFIDTNLSKIIGCLGSTLQYD
ncbi:hypothetical protein CHS0354_019595 [Potamilus streckersoni]|uniref:Uncharacterized protein n=1 Tax=Potamilus streckersoni TaxID=2493646 RepID=A0AAE0TG28_9BIVA|nr:hypothetical protein CHS0354_019595 [Potamilus streckersoni]